MTEMNGTDKTVRMENPWQEKFRNALLEHKYNFTFQIYKMDIDYHTKTSPDIVCFFSFKCSSKCVKSSLNLDLS